MMSVRLFLSFFVIGCDPLLDFVLRFAQVMKQSRNPAIHRAAEAGRESLGLLGNADQVVWQGLATMRKIAFPQAGSVHWFGGDRSRMQDGSRCKQSGMFWSAQGAENILAFRCIHASRRLEAFWKHQLNDRAALNDALPLAA